MADILEFLTEDRLRAFQVPDQLTTLQGLCRELEQLEGVNPDRMHWPRFLSKPEVCRLEYCGWDLEVCEMNDGFWVGPAGHETQQVDLTPMLRKVARRIVGNKWHRALAMLFPS